MKTAVLTLVLAMATPLIAADNELVSTLTAHLKISKDYTIAIAKQMPAADYTFKPNPAEMSFGEQLNHIANANEMFGGAVGGYPEAGQKKTDRESVITALNKSFDDAIAGLSKLSDADLHRVVKTPEGEHPILETVLLMLDHTTHHRAQCIVYLRVKGIKPTDYNY